MFINIYKINQNVESLAEDVIGSIKMHAHSDE